MTTHSGSTCYAADARYVCFSTFFDAAAYGALMRRSGFSHVATCPDNGIFPANRGLVTRQIHAVDHGRRPGKSTSYPRTLTGPWAFLARLFG